MKQRETMDLNKSKTNAVVMSSFLVLSFTITLSVFIILIPYLTSGNIESVISDPNELSSPGALGGLTILIILLIGILIAIGAFWLYRFFGDAYYGKRGAIRWVLFGASFAILIAGLEWVIGDRLNILKGILQFLSIFLAYVIARWVIPLQKE